MMRRGISMTRLWIICRLCWGMINWLRLMVDRFRRWNVIFLRRSHVRRRMVGRLRSMICRLRSVVSRFRWCIVAKSKDFFKRATMMWNFIAVTFLCRFI